MPYLRLLGAQIAIGAAAIFARYALTGAGPVAVSALRLGIAAIVAVLVARGFQPLSARREIAFATAGFALALHFAAWIASLEYASVAISTLLVTTTPLWTEAYDVVRERRAPRRTMLLALALAFAGVATIALAHGAGRSPHPGHLALGEALALLGSFAIGAYLIVVRDAGGLPGGTRMRTTAIVARTYTWSALFLVLASAALREGPPALADTTSWFGVLAMALGSQLLGHTTLNAALRDFTPSVIALSTLLEPAVAAIFAAMLFQESLSWQVTAGGVLVLIAVALTLRDAPVNPQVSAP